MIAITTGYSLSANDSAPGVKNFYIASTAVEAFTPATGGPITAFTTPGDAGEWLAFENAQGEGDWSVATTAGSGGKEHTTTVNYRIGGLDQAKLTQMKQITDSQKVYIIAEHSDGKFFNLTRNGFTPSAGTIASGTTGGGAAGVGGTVSFTATDIIEPSQITVTITTTAKAALDAITDA